jgi:hypothetical protein
MAKFPIIKTQRTVPGQSPAVRANIDVSTDAGVVSSAIRQGGARVAGALQRGAAQDFAEDEAAHQRRLKLEEADQKNRDTLGRAEINTARTKLQEEYDTFAETATPEELEKWWDDEKRQADIDGMITADLSDEEADIQRQKNAAFFSIGKTKALGQRVERNKGAALRAADESLTSVYREGDDKKIAQAELDFARVNKENGVVASDILLKRKAAREAGEKLRSQDAENGVFAAVEAGQFEAARELATNPDISEKTQASLRSSIETAENKVKTDIEQAQKKAVEQSTNQTLLEMTTGELTVPTLDKRFADGLIERSEWKSMRDAMTSIPDNSTPQASGELRRINADFEAGDITRDKANKQIMAIFSDLDAVDRETVFADLEDIGTKVIGTAKRNAYDEGRTLLSSQFVGIQTEGEFQRIVGITGLTEKDKKRLNRRFQAELSNRDLYERAVDQRFREMRAAGVTEPAKFESESLNILLTYQRRKDLKLEGLEAEVAREQQEIVGETLIGPQEDPRIAELRRLTQ